MKPPLLRWAALLLLLAPLVLYWYVFERYAVNVPMWDDFVLIDFLLRLRQPLPWIEKLRLFFAQHNAHRIVYDRLVTYLVYALTGQMDFKWMMLIGNLSLMGLLWLWYAALRQAKRSVVYLVPVPYWLLSMQGYENTFWAMASLQNYTVILLAFSSIYLLITKRLVWAAVVAVVATFTSGNGQMTFFIGLLLLAYERRPGRDWAVWMGVLGLTLTSYFWQYRSFPPEVFTVQFVVNFLAFSGAAFAQTSGSVALPVALGLLLTTWLAVGFVRWVVLPLWRNQALASPFVQFLFATVAFVVGSALLVAMAHRSDTPMAETLVSRYKIYSHILLITSYLLAIYWFRSSARKVVLVAAWMGGVVFMAYAYYTDWGNMTYRRQDATLTAFNFRRNGTTLMGISHARSLDSLYRVLETEQLYRLPDYVPTPTEVVHPPNLRLVTQEVQQKLLYFEPLVPTLLIRHDTLAVPAASPTDGLFVVLRSPTQLYAFNTRQWPAGKRHFLTTGRVFRAGFSSEIHQPLLPSGVYQLGLLRMEHGRSRLELTPQEVVVGR